MSTKVGLKVSVTKLVRIDFDAKTCIRYSGREQTHGYVFGEEKKITRELLDAILAQPDTVGEPEQAAA